VCFESRRRRPEVGVLPGRREDRCAPVPEYQDLRAAHTGLQEKVCGEEWFSLHGEDPSRRRLENAEPHPEVPWSVFFGYIAHEKYKLVLYITQYLTHGSNL